MGFAVGMAGWVFILAEIFLVSVWVKIEDPIVTESLNVMRFIVTVGWAIYPAGYFFGYLQGGVDDDSLNLVYNLADFVNKIAFCLAIWTCAKASSEGHKPWEAFASICQSSSNSPKVEA